MVDRYMSAEGLNMQQRDCCCSCIWKETARITQAYQPYAGFHCSRIRSNPAGLPAACQEHYKTLTEKQYMLADGSACRSAVAAVARLEADCRYA